jgi:hypothetical protein
MAQPASQLLLSHRVTRMGIGNKHFTTAAGVERCKPSALEKGAQLSYVQRHLGGQVTNTLVMGCRTWQPPQLNNLSVRYSQ